VKSTARAPWLDPTRIDALVQVEPALLLVGGALAMWALYFAALRRVSRDRHLSLRRELANLSLHAGVFGALALAYFTLEIDWFERMAIARLRPWLGLAVLVQGAVLFVKTLKSLFTQLLFVGHLREGVPALLINAFTGLAAIGTGAWLAAHVFQVRLTPLLATSAIASVVVGLAVQDSLGNLFAGIAMQFDKPYEIGDWVEIVGLAGKWTGRVEEISWRATVLVGLCDESVSIPNRAVGQAQVYNFSQRGVPIARHLELKLPLTADTMTAKGAIARALGGVEGIAMPPEPLAQCSAIGEGGVTVRCTYWVRDYGAQWVVADRAVEAVIAALAAEGIALSPPADPPAGRPS